jgi:hypothetical protein
MLSQLAKMLCLPYVYVFSSTKLEIRAEQFSLEAKMGGVERVREGDRRKK